EYAPVELTDHVIMIIHTNKKRTLAGSKYNERRAQCEAALADLKKELSIASLGELSTETFDVYKHVIKDETNRKRAKHAVYENARTLAAQAKLHAGVLHAFGELMNASHISLRHYFEVNGREMDTIDEAACE